MTVMARLTSPRRATEDEVDLTTGFGHRKTLRARVTSSLVLAAVVGWGLWSWRSELTGVPYLDDSSVHEQMVRFAQRRLQAGHMPLTSWFPYLGLGSPQFLHYQSLPAMLTGALGLATGGNAAFRITLYLLLSLWPLSVYWSARLFDLGRSVALLTAAAAPLLISAVGVGYEAKAYVWIGYGVWAQLWASWMLPLAWAFTWRAMSSRRAVVPAAVGKDRDPAGNSTLAPGFSCGASSATSPAALCSSGTIVTVQPASCNFSAAANRYRRLRKS